jgi:hypothetical protein
MNSARYDRDRRSRILLHKDHNVQVKAEVRWIVVISHFGLATYYQTMGSNFVNYQVRSTDDAAVIAAASALVQGRAYVSPAKTGWVTLYDERSESQNAYEIGRIGEELSLKLNTAVLAIVVNDSTLLVYYLFDNSDLLDEYNSNPLPVNPNANTDQKYRFAGRPEILLNYCPAGTSREQIEKSLRRGNELVEGGFATNIFAEERLGGLTAAMQIDPTRATSGFNDFERRYAAFPDSSKFTAIGGKPVKPLQMRRIPPQIPKK